jgi:hypothetical protein
MKKPHSLLPLFGASLLACNPRGADDETQGQDVTESETGDPGDGDAGDGDSTSETDTAGPDLGTNDGECEIRVLASEVSMPGAIAIDATDVYWVGGYPDGYLMKCAKSGCDTPIVLLTDQPAPTDVVVDGAEIFWTLAATTGLCSSDGLAMRCDASNCAATAEPFVTSLCPSGMAVDEMNVYLAEFGGGTGTLERCARSGCGGNSETLAEVPGGPTSVALSGNMLVWTAGPTGLGTNGAIMICEKTACMPQVLADGPDIFPGQVATDAQNAYWTNGDGSIMKCALTGCDNTPHVLASGFDGPYAIATDGIDVVWTTAPMGAGGIYRIAADGSELEPTTLVIGEMTFTPSSLALDEEDIYWTDLNTDLVAAIHRCKGTMP